MQPLNTLLLRDKAVLSSAVVVAVTAAAAADVVFVVGDVVDNVVDVMELLLYNMLDGFPTRENGRCFDCILQRYLTTMICLD